MYLQVPKRCILIISSYLQWLISRHYPLKELLRTGFEPVTYGCLHSNSFYSPPLYQLSYRRMIMYGVVKHVFDLLSCSSFINLGNTSILLSTKCPRVPKMSDIPHSYECPGNSKMRLEYSKLIDASSWSKSGTTYVSEDPPYLLHKVVSNLFKLKA